MIINSISIKKFRGFQDVYFELGSQLTVIAGQNGTQKTTLLGMLSQPFSITDTENPLFGENPLCGGNFKSAFAEKFKLSEVHDIPKGHEWTLNLNREEEPNFTLESIKRGNAGQIRFWKKGDRSRGSGYIQKPVIYLSLSRLLPIGEDKSLDSNYETILSDEETRFYQEWHNKILIIPDVEMTSIDYLESKQKNTLGVNTSFYDWRMNSAGQDNIGKILLAILSFKRLKDKYGLAYTGGILAIDELDATLYPASQMKLVEALRKFASQLTIQVIYTTHSLTLLEQACELQNTPRIEGQTKVIYLSKVDSEVKVAEGISFTEIKHKLNVTLDPSREAMKVPVFTEDKEGEIFLKALLKTKRTSRLKFFGCTFGCSNLIELSQKSVPGFKFPDSLIVLDGDVSSESSSMKRIKKCKNIMLLPGGDSPEQIISKYLYELLDASTVWDRIQEGYSKQLVFKNFTFAEIQGDRKKAKKWFNEQKKYWGRGCVKVINPWIAENKEIVETFLKSFRDLYNRFAKILSLSLIK